MTETDDIKAKNLSPAIKQMIDDGTRLVSYIAKNGTTELPADLAQAMVSAKFKAATEEWTDQDETDFLVNYDKLSSLVYPVTVESIHAITPNPNSRGKRESAAEHSVKWYRRATMFSLGILLIAHLYFIIGNNLRVNLTEVFDKRTQMHLTADQADINIATKPGDARKTQHDQPRARCQLSIIKAME